MAAGSSAPELFTAIIGKFKYSYLSVNVFNVVVSWIFDTAHPQALRKA